MKSKKFVPHFEEEDLSQFPHPMEHSECAAGHDSLAKYTEKTKSLQVSAGEGRFQDSGKEEECIHAFINPSSLCEQEIIKMASNIQMELIDLKANSSLKIKFDEPSSASSASDMILFWRSSTCEDSQN